MALTFSLALEILVAALLVVGAAFALVGSFGLVRLDDLPKRLHGPSKATTLGVGGVLLASALGFTAQGQAGWQEVLITVFVVVTAPLSAHLLMKAAMAADPSLRPPPPREGPKAGPAGRPPGGSGQFG